MFKKLINILVSLLLTLIVGVLIFWIIVFGFSSLYQAGDTEGNNEGAFLYFVASFLISNFVSVYIFHIFYKKIKSINLK